MINVFADHDVNCTHYSNPTIMFTQEMISLSSHHNVNKCAH